MAIASFDVHSDLAAFLGPERRGGPFRYAVARAATLKNALEALGIPHTEVARLAVNGNPATLDRIVRDGDAVGVEGWAAAGIEQEVACLHFVADAHLGGLARFLRMLGYDTVHDNGLSDETIRTLASVSRRVVLTRDRELLKCREILFGAYVRALAPPLQLHEVARRFGLGRRARPFTLCLRCNVALSAVDKQAVIDCLPVSVAEQHENFQRCGSCKRVYWPGSHYAHMRAALAGLLKGMDDAAFSMPSAMRSPAGNRRPDA